MVSQSYLTKETISLSYANGNGSIFMVPIGTEEPQVYHVNVYAINGRMGSPVHTRRVEGKLQDALRKVVTEDTSDQDANQTLASLRLSMKLYPPSGENQAYKRLAPLNQSVVS